MSADVCFWCGNVKCMCNHLFLPYPVEHHITMSRPTPSHKAFIKRVFARLEKKMEKEARA